MYCLEKELSKSQLKTEKLLIHFQMQGLTKLENKKPEKI